MSVPQTFPDQPRFIPMCPHYKGDCRWPNCEMRQLTSQSEQIYYDQVTGELVTESEKNSQ